MPLLIAAALGFLALCLILSLLISWGLLRRASLLDSKNDAAGKVQPTVGLPPGTPAPAFQAPTLEGGQMTLDDCLGRKTLFAVISASCAGCRLLLPLYRKAAPLAARTGIRFVLVSDENPDDTRALLREYDVDLPVILAPAGTNRFVHDYGLSTMPSYCLVGEDGNVIAGGTNSPDAPDRYWQAMADLWQDQAEHVRA